MKNRILRFVLRKLVAGVTIQDAPDLSLLNDKDYHRYLLNARRVFQNPAWQTELERLKYKQGQYLQKKAKTADDLDYGRAAIFVINELQERFKYLDGQLQGNEELTDTY